MCHLARIGNQDVCCGVVLVCLLSWLCVERIATGGLEPGQVSFGGERVGAGKEIAWMVGSALGGGPETGYLER